MTENLWARTRCLNWTKQSATFQPFNEDKLKPLGLVAPSPYLIQARFHWAAFVALCTRILPRSFVIYRVTTAVQKVQVFRRDSISSSQCAERGPLSRLTIHVPTRLYIKVYVPSL